MNEDYYDFGEQLQRGQVHEARVGAYLETELGMRAESTNMDLQRLGIDFIAHSSMSSMSIEVKADMRAHDTGNAFIETVSVEKNGVVEKLGWVRTSLAQVLIYYIPVLGDMYFIDMPPFKRAASGWATGKYPERSIPNKTYVGRGLLMPLRDLRNYAFAIRKIDPVIT